MPPPPRRARPVSIRDVAERAGVSVGSASRVVNDAPNVTEALRQRVREAVAALGYRPNHAARTLRLQSSRTIGCMLTDVTNPLYGQLFHAIEERLRHAGYVTLLANSLNSPEREVDILGTFAARGLDAVVIAPGNERDPAVVAAVETLPVPVVVLDRDMAAARDRVQFDHVPGMRAVVAHLAALGHRRIALVLSQPTTRPMRRRIEGWRAGLRAAGLAVDETLLVQLPSAVSPAFGAISALLARRDPPTALIVLGTTVLHDALNAIATRRLRIPEDLSLVAVGDPEFARSHAPPLTTLRVDLDAVADQACAMLLERLREGGAEAPPRTVKVSADLILRQSCAPPPR